MARNNLITLPPYYEIESQKELESEVNYFLSRSRNASFKLWEPLEKALPIIDTAWEVDNLKHIDEIKLNSLIDELSSVKHVKLLDKGDKWNTWGVVLGIALAGIIITIVCYKLCVIRNRRRSNKGRSTGNDGCEDRGDIEMMPTGREKHPVPGTSNDKPDDAEGSHNQTYLDVRNTNDPLGACFKG